MRRELFLPASIVLGSAMVGGGLFLGLQRRPPAEGTPPRSSVERTPSATAPREVVAPLQPGALQRAQNDARAALFAQKDVLMRTCWQPAVTKAPEPATSHFIYNFSFDANGRLIGQGLTEIRGESRPEVASCLRRTTLTLTIPAPGANLAVDVDIKFP